MILILSTAFAIHINYAGKDFDPVREIRQLQNQKRRDDAIDLVQTFKNSDAIDQDELQKLEEELEYLQEKFLAAYPKKGIRSTIEEGRQADRPVFITDRYAVDSLDTKEKTFLAVGTHVSTVLDREENAAFQVISNILFNSEIITETATSMYKVIFKWLVYFVS